MTDTQNKQSPPLKAPGPANSTQRRPAKPFGTINKERELMIREQALQHMSRQQAFDNGWLSVKELDDEELRYGMCRNERGIIPHSPGRTTLIPKDKYDEMIAEHELRFQQQWRQKLDDMVEVVISIAEDDCVEPRDRLEAAKYAIERVAGKTPERVSVTVKNAPWEELLGQVTGIAQMSRAEHRAINGAGIVEAELVDDEENHHDDDTGVAEDPVQPQNVPAGSQEVAEQTVVPVHQARPSEPPEQPTRQTRILPHEAEIIGEKPKQGEPYDEYVTQEQLAADVRIRTNNNASSPAAEQRADVPDKPQLMYGRRADEKRSYAQQARDAQDLVVRRKAHKQKIEDAKKQRKIKRALGADAIETDITGATVSEDGSLTFIEE